MEVRKTEVVVNTYDLIGLSEDEVQVIYALLGGVHMDDVGRITSSIYNDINNSLGFGKFVALAVNSSIVVRRNGGTDGG